MSKAKLLLIFNASIGNASGYTAILKQPLWATASIFYIPDSNRVIVY